jgi:hypothetical protein
MIQDDKRFNVRISSNATLNLPYIQHIYSNTHELPENWDVLAKDNIFLSRKYLEVLEEAAPSNMICHFIGIFKETELVAIAISQYLDFNQIDCYGNKRQVNNVSIKNFLFKKFASSILVIGNNMLSGQHAFELSESANRSNVLIALNDAAIELKSRLEAKGINVHMTTFKDFVTTEIDDFSSPVFSSDLRFSVQPNMVLDIKKQWKLEQDYVNAFTKKYHSQYNRGRSKCVGVEKRELSLDDILAFEDQLYELYLHVASNAPFNTFYLPKHHFTVFKKKLGSNFLLFGYFSDEKLIGFKTIINNGEALDSYFLGYDDSIQKEKMLYLNMLYDMTAHAILHGFRKIVFGRTALEIKSSIGATPETMIGLMRHSNKTINRFLPFFFNYLEPKIVWNERSPFQTTSQ